MLPGQMDSIQRVWARGWLAKIINDEIMSNSTTILLFLILIAGLVLFILILSARKGSGSIRLRQAELKIDFERGSWSRERPKERPNSNQSAYYNSWLELKGTDWQYPLHPRSQVYIGNRNDNDIRLMDSIADARQAVIYSEDNRFKINNLSV